MITDKSEPEVPSRGIMDMGWQHQTVFLLQGASAFLVTYNLFTLLIYTGGYLVTGVIPGYWIWGAFMFSLYGFGLVQIGLFFWSAAKGRQVHRAYLVDAVVLVLAMLTATYWFFIQPIPLNAWLGNNYLPVVGVNIALLLMRAVVKRKDG